MCIDIVEVWFGISHWQISSVFDKVICPRGIIVSCFCFRYSGVQNLPYPECNLNSSAINCTLWRAPSEDLDPRISTVSSEDWSDCPDVQVEQSLFCPHCKRLIFSLSSSYVRGQVCLIWNLIDYCIRFNNRTVLLIFSKLLIKKVVKYLPNKDIF